MTLNNEYELKRQHVEDAIQRAQRLSNAGNHSDALYALSEASMVLQALMNQERKNK